MANTELPTARNRDKLGRVQPPSPTIPRWQLGKELTKLREAKQLSYEQVAKAVGLSASSIRRYEAGTTGIGRPALTSLLNLYEVTDDGVRERLIEWQTRGKKPGWWSRFGRLPEETTTLLGFESAATNVRMFEQAVVPGLLQTEAYARAMMAALAPGLSDEELDKYVELRVARQENLDEATPEMWMILEETAIRRPVGGAAAMQEQLSHLCEIGKRWPLQIVPLEVGPHPGTAGGFMIWEFEERTPVVFVDSQAGNLFLEEEDDIARFTLIYNHMRAVALSPEQSVKLIKRTIQEISK
jgi:transcriptional regulator with XRE-family HTH domain